MTSIECCQGKLKLPWTSTVARSSRPATRWSCRATSQETQVTRSRSSAALSKSAELHSVSEARLAEVLPPSSVFYTAMEPCNERLSGNRTGVDRTLALQGSIATVCVGSREPGTLIEVNKGMKRLKEGGLNCGP
ncbi:hypothetical protein F5Y19DRAFT_488889 [Xylariaceae sp. FL1651]|nr:hypothetical protein F5Y19DRAFT_488889 [Xylariaceae sp. FL1651]